eukprot:86195-Pleurochrysis_carterae.AAC.1
MLEQIEIEEHCSLVRRGSLDLVLQTCATGHRAYLTSRHTVALGTTCVHMDTLVRRHQKRLNLTKKRERMQELSVWQFSLVDWRIKYESPEEDKPLVDHGWIDFHDCNTGSFFVSKPGTVTKPR